MSTTPAEADVAALAAWLAALPGHRITGPLALTYFRAAARRRLGVPNDTFVRDWRSSVAEPLVLAAD
jgi:hypothetical protein